MLKEEKKNNYSWRHFFDLIRSTKPNMKLFTIGLLFSLSNSFISLIIPKKLQSIIDNFDISNIDKKIIYLVVILFLFQVVMGIVSYYLLSKVGLKSISNLRERLWRKVVNLPTKFFDKNKSGEVSSRIVNDTSVIYDLVSSQFSAFISAIILIIGAIFFMFQTDFWLTTIVLGAIPVLLVVFLPLGKIMAKLSRNIQGETAQLNSFANQMISENKLIKASTAEDIEMKNGHAKINMLLSYGLKQAKIMATIGPVIQLIMMAVVLFVIAYGGIRVSTGAITAGALMAFIMYVFNVMMPITTFASFFAQIQKTKGATERISEILREDEEDTLAGNNVDVERKDIDIKDLNFMYESEDNKKFSLSNINIHVEGGTTAALVGPSGGGKTTLFSLLERFYLPDSGAIYLDGEDINSITLESWRSQIGYVSQEHNLISGTIRDNLIYGLKDIPSDKEIIESCEQAYAWEFIKEFPDGIDTDVGEKGMNLSGGQRQRVAIARAFLKNPKILLLDEATANLDSQSEHVIQAAMGNIMQGRTVLVIAHRLSTILDADNIVFIEGGRVTGQGKHEELRRTHALYNEFCEQQLR